MVEQEAVNFEVAGSSPASGAKKKTPNSQLHLAVITMVVRQPAERSC